MDQGCELLQAAGAAIDPGQLRFSPPVRGPSLSMRLLLKLAAKLPMGELRIETPTGQRHCFTGGEPGPKAVLRIHRDRAARRFLIGGHVGFAEAYLAGDWDSPDLTALIELLALTQERLGQTALSGGWVGRTFHRVAHWRRANTKSGSRRNIAAHYDLGNAFYAKWLDPTMTYSSAIFDGTDEDLVAGHNAKYDRLGRLLELDKSHHLLEIGCGWGGFAEYTARTFGCRITAITISPSQFEYAKARIAAAGLSDRVELKLMDYREVQGSFDRIASIEMIEAVGETYWPAYFETLRDRLKPGGMAALQAITIADRFFEEYRRGADFIQRYVFPGGMLPSQAILRGLSHRFGLTWIEDASFDRHYARTLAVWRERFEKAWPEIRTLGFDERFRRLWNYYLAYCEGGFLAGTIDVQQIALRRA